MSSIAVAAALMAGLGLAFATILAVAYRFLKVPEDPRIEQVEGMLPNSNCGACGEPGCRAFAERLVRGDAQPGQCTVSSPETVETIATYLGVDAGVQARRIARLHCAGGDRQSAQLARYSGPSTCATAQLVAAGGKGCPVGCLGLGDCMRACTFDAIQMTRHHLPQVSVERCTACGACITACPRDLLEILPLDQHLLVQCSLPLAGDEARALCTVACDACGRCAADGAPGLITMRHNLPVLAPENAHLQAPQATWRCPTGAICWVEGRQFKGDERSTGAGPNNAAGVAPDGSLNGPQNNAENSAAPSRETARNR